jgi:hypothetical protein
MGPAEQVCREWQQCDEEKKEQVEPEETPVHFAHKVELEVITDPVGSQHDEA